MYKLSFYLPKETLITLYNAIVLPHLMYCNVAWGNTYKSYLSRLIVIQNKIVRYITLSPYRSKSLPLFIELHILPFDKLVALSCMIFMYKMGYAKNSFLKDAFVLNSSIHAHNTRQRNLIRQPLVRTELALQSFITVCIKEWNSLPSNIKTAPSLGNFKDLCRSHIDKMLKEMLKEMLKDKVQRKSNK